MIERVVSIPTDHPCLPGHFPGRPIVPAVVILDEVRAIITETLPVSRPITIDHCKFQDFVLPGQPFDVSLTITADSIVNFACRASDDGRLLAKGGFRLEPVERST